MDASQEHLCVCVCVHEYECMDCHWILLLFLVTNNSISLQQTFFFPGNIEVGVRLSKRVLLIKLFSTAAHHAQEVNETEGHDEEKLDSDNFFIRLQTVVFGRRQREDRESKNVCMAYQFGETERSCSLGLSSPLLQ